MDATVVFVAYRTESIDCSWIPAEQPVIVVHNDDHLQPDRVDHQTTTHLHPGANIGFGAAVNLAADEAPTKRLVFCNPDTALTKAHWDALAGTPDEVVTVPLVDDDGQQTSVVSPYWTPLALAVSTFRLGTKLAPLGSRRRQVFGKLAPGWVRNQNQALQDAGSWSLDSRWVSGAVFSVDRERFRSVGGFDDRYFLYYEDTDLCHRLAESFPDMSVRLADCPPGIHAVGGSSGDRRSAVELLRRRAAVSYGATQDGLAWLPFRLADSVLSHPPRP